MGNREEFEKWAVSECYSILRDEKGKYKRYNTFVAERVWQARQPAIDALKDKANESALSVALAVSTAKNLEAERDGLKAEVERLNRFIERRHAMMAPAVREASIAAMKETK